jgi:tetratricopeptide (TPR) repeat protein
LQLAYYEQACEAFEQIIKLKPDDIAAHMGMGAALRQIRRNEEALAAYDAAIVLDPNNALAYREKAEILDALGRSYEARPVLQQARDRGITVEAPHYPPLLVDCEPGNFEIEEKKENLCLSVDVGDVELQSSQIRIDFVQQFLTNAGLKLQTFPGEVGFIARVKRPVWKSWFPKGLYTRILFDSQLDQRTVEAIAQDARRHKCDHALVIINRQPVTSGWAQVNILRAEQGTRRFVCLPIDEALIQKGIASKREYATLRHYMNHRLGESFDPYDVDLPVSGVVSFFGRQRITEELMEDLRHGRRIGLFGMRKAMNRRWSCIST